MADAELKIQLRSDLTAAMKSRNELQSATIRMALAAITNEEVAGKEARELSNDDVVKVLQREAKKRRESAEAYDAAKRPELADRERAELGVLDGYLPKQLDDDALAQIVAAAVGEVDATGPAAMGAVMKIVQPKVAGQADGGRVAAMVKSQLGM